MNQVIRIKLSYVACQMPQFVIQTLVPLPCASSLHAKEKYEINQNDQFTLDRIMHFTQLIVIETKWPLLLQILGFRKSSIAVHVSSLKQHQSITVSFVFSHENHYMSNRWIEWATKHISAQLNNMLVIWGLKTI